MTHLRILQSLRISLRGTQATVQTSATSRRRWQPGPVGWTWETESITVGWVCVALSGDVFLCLAPCPPSLLPHLPSPGSHASSLPGFVRAINASTRSPLRAASLSSPSSPLVRKGSVGPERAAGGEVGAAGNGGSGGANAVKDGECTRVCVRACAHTRGCRTAR